MPFLFVYCIPDGTPDDLLIRLRIDLVEAMARLMNTPVKSVQVIIPQDRLREPLLTVEGGNTIYLRLDTGMFRETKGRNPQEHTMYVKSVTHELANLAMRAFGGIRNAECMVGDCNPAWTSLVRAEG